ncbi:phage virion morphogenesis protein [Ferrovibrio sp.]|uniref:phage virion morphogenesis protein n=1 Tax=Ferrovibrio sp. TaxID=1917215 RepID=UPI0035B22045
MTGASVKIDITDEAILTALRRLEDADKTLVPGVLALAGEYGVESTRARIAQGVTPAGVAFAPLNPAYAAVKRGPGILRESGQLSAELAWQLIGADSVEWGSNLIRAAIHQFGGTIEAKDGGSLAFMLGEALIQVQSVTIPARPFLGVNDANQAEILNIAEDALGDLLGVGAA